MSKTEAGPRLCAGAIHADFVKDVAELSGLGRQPAFQPWDQRHVMLAVRAKVRDGRTGGVVGECDAQSRGQCVATNAGALVAAKAHVASRGVAVGQWRAEQGPVA